MSSRHPTRKFRALALLFVALGGITLFRLRSTGLNRSMSNFLGSKLGEVHTSPTPAPAAVDEKNTTLLGATTLGLRPTASSSTTTKVATRASSGTKMEASRTTDESTEPVDAIKDPLLKNKPILIAPTREMNATEEVNKNRTRLFVPLGIRVAKPSHEIISTNTSNTMEYPHICFYGSTRFYFHKKTTRAFVVGLLTLLRDVALRSYNDALLGKGKVTVLVPIQSFRPHFANVQEIIAFLQPVVSKYDKLNVEMVGRAHQKAARLFKQTKCSWVVSTKLDADDFLSPGYLDWIAQKVIITLDNGTRGAVVGGRYIGQLQYAYGRCEVDTNGGPHFFWPGEAMGQTRIFRRDVFEALGMPFEALPHTSALSETRRKVYQKIVHVNDNVTELPLALVDNFKIFTNYSLQKSSDAEMEKETGIRMIETHRAGFGARLKTPLSSHMNYDRLKTAKNCSDALWSTIINDAMFMNGIKSRFEYVHDTLKVLNASLYDTCKSSRTFSQFFKVNRFNGSTCEEMERNWQSVLHNSSISS